MSEATARMNLRDYVRDDDIDFAIKVPSSLLLPVSTSSCHQVMLESFLQAQKISIRHTLQRLFKKYLTFGEENNQLLMHQLQGLIRDAEKYHQVHCQLLSFPPLTTYPSLPSPSSLASLVASIQESSGVCEDLHG
jgi:DNA replicative helicase MCM subunit Mcm2 (Cdc46/Mcm family)